VPEKICGGMEIGDRGLFDVDASRFVDAVIPNPSRG
jgi:hypothetical protein